MKRTMLVQVEVVVEDVETEEAGSHNGTKDLAAREVADTLEGISLDHLSDEILAGSGMDVKFASVRVKEAAWTSGP